MESICDQKKSNLRLLANVAQIFSDSFQTYWVCAILAVTRWIKVEHKLNWTESNVPYYIKGAISRPVNTNTCKDLAVHTSFSLSPNEYRSVLSIEMTLRNDTCSKAPLYGFLLQSRFQIHSLRLFGFFCIFHDQENLRITWLNWKLFWSVKNNRM